MSEGLLLGKAEEWKGDGKAINAGWGLWSRYSQTNGWVDFDFYITSPCPTPQQDQLTLCGLGEQ